MDRRSLLRITYACSIALILIFAFLYMSGRGREEADSIVSREAIKNRGNNSYVYNNKDGSITSVVFADAVNYQDNQGNWRQIDTAIKANKTSGTPFSARFGNNGRLSFIFKDKLVEFVPLGSTSSKGIVSKNKIIYQDIFKHCDLKYTVEPDRVKEELILKTPKAPNSFIFAVVFDGKLPKIKNNSLDFGSFRTMPPVAIDAKGRHGGAAIDLKKINGKTCLVVGVDPDWAQLAEYPIVIDPTILIQPDNLTGKDAYVTNADPLVNYGEDERLRVSASSEAARSYLQFNLSAIPPYSTVSQAILKVYAENSSLSSLTARRVLSAWIQSYSEGSQDAISWVNQPRFGEPIGSAGTVPSADWTAIDMTGAVTDWVKNRAPNMGLVLMTDEVSGAGNAVFMSSNYSADPQLRPKLEVTYVLENMPPASSITSIEDGDFIHGAQVEISGIADDGDDGSGISRVDVSTNGGETWEQATGTTNWSYIWSLPADGEYQIVSRAVDAAGNAESNPAEIKVTADNTLPEASISTPPEGSTVKGKVILEGTATDTNFDSYMVEYGQGATPESFVKIGSEHRTTVEGGPLEFANPTSMNGQYTFRLTAKDQAGNIVHVDRILILENIVQTNLGPHKNYDADTDLCALCHRSHVALSGRLNYWEEPEATYCGTCHHGIAGASNTKAELDESASHHPIRDRYFSDDPQHTMDCHDCHDPHGNKRDGGTSPENGAEDVPIDTVIEVIFSETIDQITLHTSSFIVMDEAGAKIDGTVTYSGETKIAAFDPAMDLDPGAFYRVIIKKSVADELGNTMDNDFSFSFRTAGP